MLNKAERVRGRKTISSQAPLIFFNFNHKGVLMRLFIIVIGLFVLTGCAGNGYKQFYKPFVDPKSNPDFLLLGNNENPEIFSSNDLNKDVRTAKSRYYWPIGVSSFNGEMGTQLDIIEQARSVGASLVFVYSKFAETRTITTPLYVPNNKTTVYSSSTDGRVNGYGGNAAYNSNTTGTATTYGTSVVPITKYQQRFNQEAVFLVKVKRKGRLGVYLLDLPPEIRTKYQRNTGAYIDVVKEDSPAFEANLLPEDVIIEFNGTAVRNQKHLGELINSLSPTGEKCTMKIIRNGVEKSIDIQIMPL